MALFVLKLPKVGLGLDLPNTIRIRNVMSHRPLLSTSFAARLTAEVPDGVEVLGYLVVAAACLYCSYLAYRYCCETYVCNRLRSLEAQASHAKRRELW